MNVDGGLCCERMRVALPLCILLGTIASSQALNRTSLFNPNLWWVCREPSADEKASMIALNNPTFGISTNYDPIGITGGCMPDATCKSGVSAWTNVFGCACLVICFCRRICVDTVGAGTRITPEPPTTIDVLSSAACHVRLY